MKIVNSVTLPTKDGTNQESRELNPEHSAPVCISFEIDDDDVLPPSSPNEISRTEMRPKSLDGTHEEGEECHESNLNPILDRDSFCSDEWENDDDLGYVTIQLTEQEFFEMEEVFWL
jgi:hypothetical protein